MDIFSNYTGIIKKALDHNDLSKSMNESYGLGHPTSRYELRTFNDEKSNLTLSSRNDLDSVALKMGVTPILNQKIGHHPDFSHLKHTTNTEKHYIVSAFIDIRKSTNLYKRYDEETIYMITNTIQLAAIAACSIFGGFIQRIQGDGIFVYFGKKGLDKSKANEHALTAVSLFTYFMKNDLKKIFEEKGIETIHTTIGVDFGDDDKVLWAMAGINDTSEIATYSLHTNLASKMQGYARANQIVTGQYVKDKALLDSELYEVVPEKRYIFENPSKSFYYTQYIFNWLKYLKSLNYIATSSTGQLIFKPQDNSLTTFGVSISNGYDSLKETASLSKPYYGVF